MYKISIDGPVWRMTRSRGTTLLMAVLQLLGACSLPMWAASWQVYVNGNGRSDILPSVFFHADGLTMFIVSWAALALLVGTIFYNNSLVIPNNVVRFGVDNPPKNLGDLVSTAFRDTDLKGWVSFSMNASTMSVEIVFTHHAEDKDAPEKMLASLKKNGVQISASAL